MIELEAGKALEVNPKEDTGGATGCWPHQARVTPTELIMAVNRAQLRPGARPQARRTEMGLLNQAFYK
jgi:hypothetical protein